jgi:hypothetical protein
VGLKYNLGMDPSPQVVTIPTLDIAPIFTLVVQKIYAFIPAFIEILKGSIGWIIGLSLVFSVFFLIVIIFTVERIKTIREKEEEIFETPVVPVVDPTKTGEAALAKRWESVKEHINTDNPNDWRQAIIDADIILDDLLTRLGYRGESIGEKLKRAHKGDFVTLDDAWEAHKVRNQIAHEGTHFEINQHQAKRTIEHYRRVFEEFYYI